VADYVIFLTTLYGIIFHWCSQTWHSHQNVSLEQDFYFFKSLNLRPWILMPWNGLILAHYVGRGPKWVQAHSLGDLPTTLGQVPSARTWHLTQQSGQGLDHSIVLRLLAHDSNLCFVNYHICCDFLCIRSYLGLVTGLVITLLHKREFCSNWYVTLSALCPACTFNWKKLSFAGGGSLWSAEALLEALELLSLLCEIIRHFAVARVFVPAMTTHLEKWQPGKFQWKSLYFSFPCKLFFFFFVLWGTTTYRSCSSSRATLSLFVSTMLTTWEARPLPYTPMRHLL